MVDVFERVGLLALAGGVGASQFIKSCKGVKTLGLSNNAKFISNLSVVAYIIMVLRIKPTARPSISKGSPGSTKMIW